MAKIRDKFPSVDYAGFKIPCNVMCVCEFYVCVCMYEFYGCICASACVLYSYCMLHVTNNLRIYFYAASQPGLLLILCKMHTE